MSDWMAGLWCGTECCTMFVELDDHDLPVVRGICRLANGHRGPHVPQPLESTADLQPIGPQEDA